MEVDLFAIGVSIAIAALLSACLAFGGILIPFLETRRARILVAVVGLGLVGLSFYFGDEVTTPSIAPSGHEGPTNHPVDQIGRLPVIATTTEGAGTPVVKGQGDSPPRLDEKFLVGSLTPEHSSTQQIGERP